MIWNRISYISPFKSHGFFFEKNKSVHFCYGKNPRQPGDLRSSFVLSLGFNWKHRSSVLGTTGSGKKIGWKPTLESMNYWESWGEVFEEVLGESWRRTKIKWKKWECIYHFLKASGLLVVTLKCGENFTSSTAKGGGRSFKNRKPIGEVGCCESRMGIFRSPLFLSLYLWLDPFSDYLPTFSEI